MKVLAYISGYDGCGYYRIQLPSKFLNKVKDVHVKIATQYVNKDIDWADLVVLQKQTNQKALPFIQYAKQKGKKIITEVDDDYFHIPVWNPAHKYYHNKGPDLINFYRMSDAIVCSTPHLAEELSKYNPRTYALPNSLDIKAMDRLLNMEDAERSKYTQYLSVDQKTVTLEDARERMRGKTVIGWGGSPTHLRDLEQATEALIKICSENKDVLVVMMACTTDTLMKELKPEQLLLVKPVPIFMYPQVLASMEWDIGICPIEDNLFNRSKSNLKYLEFAINGFSAVCSDVENYAKTITHGVDGLLSKNTTSSWYDNLTELINDAELRKTLADNASKLVRANFSASVNYKMWETVYNEILDK